MKFSHSDLGVVDSFEFQPGYNLPEWVQEQSEGEQLSEDGVTCLKMKNMGHIDSMIRPGDRIVKDVNGKFYRILDIHFNRFFKPLEVENGL